MIIQCIGTFIDLVITVQIFIFDISRSHRWCARIWIDLRMIGTIVDIFLRSEETFIYQSPDFTPLFSYIMIA